MNTRTADKVASLEKQIPEYQRKQRQCEAKPRRALILKPTIKAGGVYTDLGGRRYFIAPDGFHRRVKE